MSGESWEVSEMLKGVRSLIGESVACVDCVEIFGAFSSFGMTEAVSNVADVVVLGSVKLVN